ncbi:hypothetical protein GCM10009630_73130 [Kribbella jejuensis]|uniref:Uncharacterized protein n=1 Tax=Kribbella jejuensis TaxID=236068 RepID=A0A542EWJ1_9ACTN|nr:hypothetical protein [Kribbella jejuensis]TQJ19715.1 hypothetical protein FB475_3889 [Kribbella jejuensis]
MNKNIKSLEALVDSHRLVIVQALQQLRDDLRNHAESVRETAPADSDYDYYAAVVSNDIYELALTVNNTLSVWSK